MTSRLRERRRDPQRTPGILRGAVVAPSLERPGVQHGVRRWNAFSWRIVSGTIALSLMGLLFLFFSADFFYVHSIAVGGLQFMTKEEVFALADIANLHIFWVDPAQVRANILRSPTIADADVQVGWPPQMVTILVEEREPVLIWEQAGVATWLDIQGRVMRQREDQSELLRIVSEVNDGPLGQNVQVDISVVSGALQLRTFYPNITVLRYDPGKGLGYQDGRGWLVWFGSGTNMLEKLKVYNQLVDNLLTRGIQPREINLVNPNATYYCCN